MANLCESSSAKFSANILCTSWGLFLFENCFKSYAEVTCLGAKSVPVNSTYIPTEMVRSGRFLLISMFFSFSSQLSIFSHRFMSTAEQMGR